MVEGLPRRNLSATFALGVAPSCHALFQVSHSGPENLRGRIPRSLSRKRKACFLRNPLALGLPASLARRDGDLWVAHDCSFLTQRRATHPEALRCTHYCVLKGVSLLGNWLGRIALSA